MSFGCSTSLSPRGMMPGPCSSRREGGVFDQMMDRWYAYVLQLAGFLVFVVGAFWTLDEADAEGEYVLQRAVGTLVVAAFFVAMGKIAEDVAFIRDAVERSQRQQ